ncbi:MAG: hypothetical protein JJU28_02245 [Cyclobacteriaceae bacterium]|nr:hypothetical protein [Cyclobacteriaceae bacterium]
MINEINEIPARAKEVYEATRKLSLPAGASYVGMGSSYYAALALYYQGISVFPEIASEFFHYRVRNSKSSLGVLISQSGRSSEVLWCAKTFKEYIAITNDPESPLATASNMNLLVDLKAGPERHSSSKTYINTLVALYNGHKIDCKRAIDKIGERINAYEDWAANAAEKIHLLISKRDQKGLFVIGNGPNVATAMQAALILSESTRFGFTGLPLSQYDHGPKESAKNSAVIAIDVNGPTSARTQRLLQLVNKAGAQIIHLHEDDVPEHLSPITTIMRLNYLAYHLAKKLRVSKTFAVGSKITEAEQE